MAAGASLCISLGLLCLSEGLKGKDKKKKKVRTEVNFDSERFYVNLI